MNYMLADGLTFSTGWLIFILAIVVVAAIVVANLLSDKDVIIAAKTDENSKLSADLDGANIEIKRLLAIQATPVIPVALVGPVTLKPKVDVKRSISEHTAKKTTDKYKKI